MAQIEVELIHHYETHVPGDVIKVDDGLAQQLVNANVAKYANKAAEKAAEGK
jgi:hypothetical protein